jgi:hypothetical protein
MINKKALSILIIVIWTSNLFAQEKIYAGFNRYISGENMDYESAQEDAKRAVLARTSSEKSFMVFETEEVPKDYKQDFITFGAVAGLDVVDSKKTFQIFINGEMWFEFNSPTDVTKTNFSVEGRYASGLDFKTKKVDKYKDFQGYLFLNLPISKLEKGKPIEVKISAKADGTGTWMMVYNYKIKTGVEVAQEPSIIKGENGRLNELRFNFFQYKDKQEINVEAGGEKFNVSAELGLTSYRLAIPEVTAARDFPVKVFISDKVIFDNNVRLEVVQPKTIYLLHHSHSDIGYTHVQKEVEDLQWKYLEDAVELGEKTESYPKEAHFVWNTEVMWAVDTYLENHSEEKRERLLEAIRKGYIEINAFWANELTSLSKPEELIQFFESYQRISNLAGVRSNSAMISDVPGYTWSLVEAMIQNDVRYFSIGTNTFHRIGSTIERWGDRPFYWESPSGKGKILCWVHEKGYSHFHTGLGFEKLENKLTEGIVLDYVKELESRSYPYNIITMRYNIGSDNGPVDPNLPEIVKEWNEKYESPKLVISSVSDAFEIFEKKYGDELPIVKGDFTPYWEDGAGSSAAETKMNRLAADKMNQVEILSSITNPEIINPAEARKVWQGIMYYNEHTWGSWNSISDPTNPFTLSQWEVKRSNVTKARKSIDKWMAKNTYSGDDKIKQIEIFNTLSWIRSGMMKFSTESNLKGNVIIDSDGNVSPIQKLSDGTKIAWINNVPALGSKVFTVSNKKYKKSNQSLIITKNSLESDFVKIVVDTKTGVISELIDKKTGRNIVDNESEFGFNQLVYVDGRDSKNRFTPNDVVVKVKENGPLMASIEVSGSVKGVKEFRSEIRINTKNSKVELINSINKENILNPEGLHITFPFAINDATTNIDNAIGDYQLGKEQIEASNNNFYTIQQYVNLSNKDMSINWVSKDAPLMEYGDITSDPIAYGFIDKYIDEPVVISYLMNNYWETNYKASQEGWHTFNYVIEIDNKSYVPTIAKKLGEEAIKPFLLRNINKEVSALETWMGTNNSNIIVNSIQKTEDGILLRLINISDKSITTSPSWNIQYSVKESDDFGYETKEVSVKLEFRAWEFKTFLLVKK